MKTLPLGRLAVNGVLLCLAAGLGLIVLARDGWPLAVLEAGFMLGLPRSVLSLAAALARLMDGE
jgi:hypothetical protein